MDILNKISVAGQVYTDDGNMIWIPPGCGEINSIGWIKRPFWTTKPGLPNLTEEEIERYLYANLRNNSLCEKPNREQ